MSKIEYYYNRISKDLDINSMEILDQIQIFNLLGQEIISNEINSMNYRINLSNLSNSIYIVSIKAENKIKRFKIHIN